MKKTSEELLEYVRQLTVAGFAAVDSEENERMLGYFLMANTRAIIPDRVSVVFQHNQTGFCIRLLVKKPRLLDDDLMYRYSVAPSLSEFDNELGCYKLIPLGATMNAAIKRANEVGERFAADKADELAMKERVAVKTPIAIGELRYIFGEEVVILGSNDYSITMTYKGECLVFSMDGIIDNTARASIVLFSADPMGPIQSRFKGFSLAQTKMAIDALCLIADMG
jgi:hypothetical protein